MALIKPTLWQRLWAWIDRDFDHLRPLSIVPVAVIPIIPLGIALAVDATETTVEMARWIAITGVIAVFLYYLYRQSLNLVRFLQRRRNQGD